MTDEAGWKPQAGTQSRFLSSQVFDLGFGGAWGGTKTESLIVAGTRFSNHPKMRSLILRRTFPELREIMDRTHALFPQMRAAWIASEKRWEFPAGGTYEFGYCSTYEEAQQYLTAQYTYIAYDQVEQLREERIWSLLVGRIRSLYSSTSCTHPGAKMGVNDCGRCIALMARCSFNPGGVGHGWVKRRYVSLPWDGTPVEDEHGNQRAFLFSQLADNPLLLEKDPDYARRLKSMPDILRRQAEGDWSAGEGVAFSELTEESHMLPEVDGIDKNWFLFGSFDWGFGHKWAFHLYAVRVDGVVLVVDSVMGRGHIPEAIVERVSDLLKHYGLRFTDLAYTVSGSDVKIQDKARGNWGPSVVEQFAAHNWYLINADQSRISGYQNTLAYLHDKKVLFCRTPGNVKGVAQMVDLATDPDSPNDVLKNDYNPETDTGGDDWYDSLRYGLMSRPLTPKEPKKFQDRIDRALAKNREEEKQPSPFTKRHPGITTKDRIEKVV